MSKKLLSRLGEPQTKNILKQRVLIQTDENELEFVLEVKGVGYLSDSKSRDVTTTEHALEQIDTSVVLIIGGDDKESDYSGLSKQIKKKVAAIIYMGDDSNHILRHYSTANLLFAKASSIEEAVKMASFLARPNDVVLFSPACDQLVDSNMLGYRFKKEVKKLLTKSKNVENIFFKINVHKER